MNELLENLIKLQSLEFEETTPKNAGATTAELRHKILPQILAHYDRLVAKGKKGVAAVRGQTCTGCHMQVPLAAVMTLKHGTDIQLCESCGRYLYLLVETESPAPAAPVKRGRKPRASKRDLHPA